MPPLIDMITSYLCCDKEELILLSKKAPVTYRRYKIPKKKGGQRIIHHPSKQTKMLQYALMETFLEKLPIHSCAVAYKRGIKSPLSMNANIHAKYRYSIRIDLSDYFHSISSQDLLNQIQKNDIKISEEDKTFITNCLFIKLPCNRKVLAIGAPSSPVVSNIVMYELDESINKIAREISSQSDYTRYADDIIFSTNIKGGCRCFLKHLREILTKTISPHLEINEDKTIVTSRGGRRVVTGVFIRPDGGISIGRKNKRYIRKLLFDLKNKKIDRDKCKYLSGYLAYSLDIEPDFYNRLTLKYGADLVEQAIKL